MEGLTTLTIYGFSIPLIILVVVGYSKRMGVSTDYAPYVSAAVGIICCIAVALTEGRPIFWGVIAGVLLGALASGIYDQALGVVNSKLGSTPPEVSD